MPTIMRIGRWKVVVYFNDHPPEHVHVLGGGGEAVFNLNCPDGPVAYRESHAMSASDLRRIQAVLNEELAAACLSWEEIHGDH